MLVTSKELFAIALKKKFAIPATNFVDQTTLRAYLSVAEQRQLPLIVSFAQAHNEILPLEEAFILGRYYAEKASVPVVLHLDHGEDIDFVKQAVDLGFTSVMIDASQDTYEENVMKTREIINYARPRGVVVEAEIGHVGSGDNYENHSIAARYRFFRCGDAKDEWYGSCKIIDGVKEAAARHFCHSLPRICRRSI